MSIKISKSCNCNCRSISDCISSIYIYVPQAAHIYIELLKCYRPDAATGNAKMENFCRCWICRRFTPLLWRLLRPTKWLKKIAWLQALTSVAACYKCSLHYAKHLTTDFLIHSNFHNIQSSCSILLCALPTFWVTWLSNNATNLA